MNEILLSDASFSEVCARVAYQLIDRRLRLYGDGILPVTDILNRLQRQLNKHGWACMSFWVCAYARSAANGELPEFTRTAFILRARLGLDFRSVAFIDYKAARRRDPRVTNRGVVGSATKDGR